MIKNIIRIPFDYAVEREVLLEGDRMTRELLVSNALATATLGAGWYVLETTPLFEEMSWKRKVAFGASMIATAVFSIVGQHKHDTRIRREDQ